MLQDNTRINLDIIYHIDKTIRENGRVVDDGLHEIFVNTAIDDCPEMTPKMEKALACAVAQRNRFKRLKVQRITKCSQLRLGAFFFMLNSIFPSN